MTGVSSMHEEGNAKLVLWDNLKGWGGEGGGGGRFRMRGDSCILVADSCYVWQKPSQHCKVIIFQLN